MPYFVYPEGASFDHSKAPFGPNLIGASSDLDEAIEIAKQHPRSTIELWENGLQVTAIEHE